MAKEVKESTSVKEDTAKRETIKIEGQPKYVYYIELNGERLEVQRKISDPDHFLSRGLPVYEWKSTTTVKNEDGSESVEEITNYSVSLADYKANKPAPARLTKEGMSNLVANLKAEGLTHEEILARLTA